MSSIKQSRTDSIFNISNNIFVGLCSLIVLYPLYFVLIASISDPNAVAGGEIFLWPKRITFIGYERIFQDESIIRGYLNTIMYTVVGTSLSLFLTLPFAFALSRKYFKGGRIFMILLLVTMFFKGGLIPTYLLMKQLHLVGSPLAVIIMGSLGAYNVIITRTFFQSSIPQELDEAAYIDGCGQIRFFLYVVLPLSKVIVSVLILFYGVASWNDFFKALIYVSDKEWHPLQLILRSILLSSQMMSSDMVNSGDDVTLQMEMMKLAASIKYGTIVVATLPVIIVYPFLQKYFVQGVMIGSVKG